MTRPEQAGAATPGHGTNQPVTARVQGARDWDAFSLRPAIEVCKGRASGGGGILHGHVGWVNPRGYDTGAEGANGSKAAATGNRKGGG
jgi:hypothetical protein